MEPPIDGLEEAGFLTSETVWDVGRAPSSLILIGGGPISIEMAQAFNRLGTRVTLLQKGPGILPRDEPDLVGRLQERLRAEGVDLRLDVEAERVTTEDGAKVVHGTEAGVGAGRPRRSSSARAGAPTSRTWGFRTWACRSARGA